jgi:hypothetical protein
VKKTDKAARGANRQEGEEPCRRKGRGCASSGPVQQVRAWGAAKRTRVVDGAIGDGTPGEELLGERAADGGCDCISVQSEAKRQKRRPLCRSGRRSAWQALKRSEVCERMNFPILMGGGPADRKTSGFSRGFDHGKDEEGASSNEEATVGGYNTL